MPRTPRLRVVAAAIAVGLLVPVQVAHVQLGASLAMRALRPLVAEYLFEGSAVDSSEQGNDGTVRCATTATGFDGESTSAYQFDSFTEHIEVTDDSTLDLGQEFSVLLRAYRTGSGSYAFSKDNSNRATNQALLVSASSIRFGVGSGFGSDEAIVELSRTTPLETWVHVAGTYDGATLTLYIDGNESATTTYAMGGVISNSQRLIIGQKNYPTDLGTSSNSRFEGRLDNVRTYIRALTSDEVAILAAE